MLFKGFLFNLNLFYNDEDDAIMNSGKSQGNSKLWSRRTSRFIKWRLGKFYFSSFRNYRVM